MHALCKCQSARSFYFHQHGFENHFTGLDSCHRELMNMNIHKAGMLRFATIYLQREKQQQLSRSEQRKRYSAQKKYK